MDLWIRSQDKEQLRKIVDLKYQKGTLEDEEIEVIIGTTQYDEWEVLGKYKTKERALEVLDEIQSKLNPQMVLSKLGNPIAETCDGLVYIEPNEYEIKELSTYVYEMPKE